MARTLASKLELWEVSLGREILDWLKSRRDPSGRIRPFTNADAAAVLGWSDLAKFGRAFGNLQSRLDFACYRVGVPARLSLRGWPPASS